MSSKSPEQVAGHRILGLVREQVALGPRVPGTPAHGKLKKLLFDRLSAVASETHCQEFTVDMGGAALSCANLIGVFRAKASGGAGQGAPLLLATHYDTRPIADREKDPAWRAVPIPGANDGGSGTAVLLDLLGWISRGRFTRDIAVAFLDAEDLGNIEGKPFSIGAAYLAEHPLAGFDPEEVLVLDMIGGKGMVLDIDANSLLHAPSLKLTREVFRIGASMGYSAFSTNKPDRVKSIICDHYPFLRRGTAVCLLIDIDYPQWHTQADTPEALSSESLGAISAAVSLFLSRFRG